jgi:hypothetical protein
MRNPYDPNGCLREDQIKRRHARTAAHIGIGIIFVAALLALTYLIIAVIGGK